MRVNKEIGNRKAESTGGTRLFRRARDEPITEDVHEFIELWSMIN